MTNRAPTKPQNTIDRIGQWVDRRSASSRPAAPVLLTWWYGYLMITGATGNLLFVNRGIGMSVIPARLNASPAITIFTLHREQQTGNE